jgi:hypothetical protein
VIDDEAVAESDSVLLAVTARDWEAEVKSVRDGVLVEVIEADSEIVEMAVTESECDSVSVNDGDGVPDPPEAESDTVAVWLTEALNEELSVEESVTETLTDSVFVRQNG